MTAHDGRTDVAATLEPATPGCAGSAAASRWAAALGVAEQAAQARPGIARVEATGRGVSVQGNTATLTIAMTGSPLDLDSQPADDERSIIAARGCSERLIALKEGSTTAYAGMQAGWPGPGRTVRRSGWRMPPGRGKEGTSWRS